MTEKHFPQAEDEDSLKKSANHFLKRSPDATAQWSVPPMQLSPDEFAKGITKEERGMLRKLLELSDIREGNAVMELAGTYGREKAAVLLSLADDLIRIPGDYSGVRTALANALREEDDHRDSNDLTKDGQRDTVDWSMRPSSDEVSELPESDPAPVSQKTPKAVMFRELPRPDMSSREFINNLTDEGRQMLGIILAMEDMRDGVALSGLEKEYGKKGFILLASHVIERKNVNPHDTGKLSGNLKDEDQRGDKNASVISTEKPGKAVAKQSGLFGGALFGRRKKKSGS